MFLSLVAGNQTENGCQSRQDGKTAIAAVENCVLGWRFMGVETHSHEMPESAQYSHA
jgi:hypothetical protein